MTPAILSLEEEASTPDDFRLRARAIVSLAPELSPASIGVLLARHRGTLVGSGPEGIVLSFPGLRQAAAFARALQAAAHVERGPWPAVGINLGSAASAADVAFAHALRRRGAPGETLISAVTGDRLTSRVRAEGPNEPAGWRGWVLPAIGLAGFLGYFFGWFYAIYWKLEAYASSGGFPCWPEWLCR